MGYRSQITPLDGRVLLTVETDEFFLNTICKNAEHAERCIPVLEEVIKRERAIRKS